MAEEIGHGEFGVVYSAKVRASGELVAVKMLKDSSDSAQELFRKEADRLTGLKHANIVSILGAMFDKTPYLIALEYMANGDLKSYLSAVSNSDALKIHHHVKLCLDVTAGFSYLQRMKFVHRDLAARNVLLDDKFTAKIGDFGMARQLFASDYYHTTEQKSNWTLPLRWMAPESFTDGTWDLRTDVWMFSVLIWGKMVETILSIVVGSDLYIAMRVCLFNCACALRFYLI